MAHDAFIGKREEVAKPDNKTKKNVKFGQTEDNLSIVEKQVCIQDFIRWHFPSMGSDGTRPLPP